MLNSMVVFAPGDMNWYSSSRKTRLARDLDITGNLFIAGAGQCSRISINRPMMAQPWWTGGYKVLVRKNTVSITEMLSAHGP
jgi:hypothetical protein